MNQKQHSNLFFRHLVDKGSHWLFFVMAVIGIIVLAVLLVDIISKSIGWLDWGFLTRFPSRFAERSGLLSALVGSVLLALLVTPLTFVLGVGTALYLEEYADDNWFSKLVKLNISNLAGVPAIVYGTFGLAVFVRWLAFGRTLLSGGLTLTLLVLPVVIVTAQEAIRAVPDSLRHASLAMGASRWQMIRSVTLPASVPGIATGIILALSRAIGEAAPLIVVGAGAFVPFLPSGYLDQFTALPIQIFVWATKPGADFQHVTSAGIIVLLVILLLLNGTAIYIRNRYQKSF